MRRKTAVRLLILSAGAVGGAIAIAGMETFSARTEFPLFAVPFATSIVTVMGAPDSAPAQPRPLVGGHLLSSLVGFVVLQTCGPGPWTAAMAVGVAMLAMHLTGTFHPPAGIDPLLIVVHDMPWSYLLVPVATGVLLLAGFAFVWHNLLAGRVDPAGRWPRRWY